MKFDPDKYDNIIFDLGGVILNLKHELTSSAFKKYGVEDFLSLYSRKHQAEFFDGFETGQMSDEEFREGVRSRLSLKITNTDFDNAWNALLQDIPAERIEILKNLTSRHRIFLLSNTNVIHANSFHDYIYRTFGMPDFTSLFEKVYYSFEIKMRKPGEEIYRYVLNDSGLDAKRTVFLDDNEPNLAGARKVGIGVIHVSPENDLKKIFG